MLSSISKQTSNLVTSIKFFENHTTDKKLLRILEIDKLASNIYTLAYTKDSKSNLDYTTKIIERI